MKRGLTLKNIVDAKIPVFDFTGEWFDAFGTPQRTGIWYIFGASGHGKTSFLLMLIRQLSAYGKILFESYEEGERSVSLKEGILRFGLLQVNSRVLVCTDSLKDMETRLKEKRSRPIVIIDSLDVCGLKQPGQVVGLAQRHPNKLFIFTGWAKGLNPAGALGEGVLYLSNQKIFVEGHRASSRGRSIGTVGYLNIWEQEAEKYHKFN
jgi:hypothetical protein